MTLGIASNHKNYRKLSSMKDRGCTDRVSNGDPNPNLPPYLQMLPAVKQSSESVASCALRPLTLTSEVYPWTMTLTFNPKRAMVTTHTCKMSQIKHRSVQM